MTPAPAYAGAFDGLEGWWETFGDRDDAAAFPIHKVDAPRVGHLLDRHVVAR
jgi:hypothetical protein